jgi:hypothetical protein
MSGQIERIIVPFDATSETAAPSPSRTAWLLAARRSCTSLY